MRKNHEEGNKLRKEKSHGLRVKEDSKELSEAEEGDKVEVQSTRS